MEESMYGRNWQEW